MSDCLDEVYDYLWNDWVLLGLLQEKNLSRIPEQNTETDNLYKYKLYFIHLLCTILSARSSFEKGQSLDSVLKDFQSALDSVIQLRDLSDTAAIYRGQWESLSIIIRLQSIVVCVVRENYVKAKALIQLYQLQKLTSGLSQDFQLSVSSARMSADIANKSTWPVFHAKLTRKLQFAYNLPRHHLYPRRQVLSVPKPSLELVRQREKKILVNFLGNLSRLRERAEAIRGSSEPITMEAMMNVTKKIHEALKRLGVEKQELKTLMDTVLSTVLATNQQKMQRILEQNLRTNF